MMGSRQVREVPVTIDAVPIEVLPLPDEGKPADFTGAVGQWNLEVTAKPTEVAVGDPDHAHDQDQRQRQHRHCAGAEDRLARRIQDLRPDNEDDKGRIEHDGRARDSASADRQEHRGETNCRRFGSPISTRWRRLTRWPSNRRFHSW